MNEAINFDIEGLIARYELHPDRQDVFVEGERDVGLVRTFLDKHGRKNVSVYSVSAVNIAPDLVRARSLPHPSKQSEVITLAMELESNGVSSKQMACLADADLEYVSPRKIVCSLLLFTDYASMELYAFCNEAVHDLLIMVAPNTTGSGANLISELTGPLQYLFAARATNFELQLQLEWIDSIEKFFVLDGGRIQFDGAEFMRRYMKIRLPEDKVGQFEARLTLIRSKSYPDVRQTIRGHDFIRLLAWYLRKKEKRTYLTDDSVRQMLYLRLSTEDLSKESMFSSLLTRIAG